MSLETVLALARESKGLNLNASIYLCAKWSTAASADYLVWKTLP